MTIIRKKPTTMRWLFSVMKEWLGRVPPHVFFHINQAPRPESASK